MARNQSEYMEVVRDLPPCCSHYCAPTISVGSNYLLEFAQGELTGSQSSCFHFLETSEVH